MLMPNGWEYPCLEVLIRYIESAYSLRTEGQLNLTTLMLSRTPSLERLTFSLNVSTSVVETYGRMSSRYGRVVQPWMDAKRMSVVGEGGGPSYSYTVVESPSNQRVAKPLR